VNNKIKWQLRATEKQPMLRNKDGLKKKLLLTKQFSRVKKEIRKF
jgi:hypothetical protein